MVSDVSLDPYSILRVSPAVDAKAIQASYRRLAKECHPDLHPDDPQAAEQFQRLSQAYALLGDIEQRRRYDLGLIAADGTPRRRPQQSVRRTTASRGRHPGEEGFHEPFSDPRFDDPGLGDVWENLDPSVTAAPTAEPFFDAFTTPENPAGEDDLDDLFKEIFRENAGDQNADAPQGAAHPVGGGASARGSLRGRDMRYGLTVSFVEAAYGCRKRLPLSSGRDVDVIVPPASDQGQVIRLSGLGLPGSLGAAAGDALVTLKVEPHEVFRRDGLDLLATISIPWERALVGGRMMIPGLRGLIIVSLPAPTQPGTLLTYRGDGLRVGELQGDLKITAQVVFPNRVDPELLTFCKKRLKKTAEGQKNKEKAP